VLSDDAISQKSHSEETLERLDRVPSLSHAEKLSGAGDYVVSPTLRGGEPDRGKVNSPAARTDSCLQGLMPTDAYAYPGPSDGDCPSP